ncbi:MAG TPA: cupin-like domain-containing protein, partial [Flavobacteriia bacterium]|nr:cupin-like domain-containing protein [Flavobacteriia bacterium]
LRAIAHNPKNLAKAIYNIFLMRHFDNLMRQIQGQKWIDWKNKRALINTNKKIDNYS